MTMKRTLPFLAAFALLSAGSARSQGHAVFTEDFDSWPPGTSVNVLPDWTSPGTGLYDTDALILAETPAEPAHSPPNSMRLVGYPCVDVDATWHLQAPASINGISLSFYYELQPNITASVSIAAHPGGPFVDAGLNLTTSCDNDFADLVTADLSHLIGTVGIDRDLYLRWSGKSCNGTSCTVFNVDSIEVGIDYQQSNGWIPVPPFNVPRAGHTATAHGKFIYIAGGDTQACNGVLQIAEVERFDPQSGIWTIVSQMPHGGRSGMGAVSLDGFLYFIGGYVPLGESTDRVLRYDPCTGAWTECASMPGDRVNMGVVARDGKIYVIGGRSWPGWTYHDTVFVYDPAKDSWSTGVDHPGRLDGFPLGDNAAVGVHGRIFLLGGMSGTGSFSDAYDEIWRYDPWGNTTGQAWKLQQGQLPEALFSALVETLDNALIVMGGFEAGRGGGFPANDEMHVFHVAPGRFAYRLSRPLPDYPSQSALLDGRLYIIGTHDGWGTHCPSGDCWSTAVR